MNSANLDRYPQNGSGSNGASLPATPGYVPSPAGGGGSDELSLRDVLLVLWKRWPLLVLSLCGSLLTAGVVTLLATPIYRSQTVLLVEQRKGDPRPDAGLLGDLMGMTQARSLQTQVEILRSETLQLGAVSEVSPELAQLPERKRPKITVDSVEDTDLIKIWVEDPRPLLAAQLANALAARYIRENRYFNQQTTSQARTFIERQMRTVQADLRQAEERLRDFRQTSGAVALDAETEERVQRLAEAHTARVQAQTEGEAVRAQVKEVERQLKRTPVRLIASSSFAENPVITQLQGEIARLEMQRAGLLKEYVPGAPEVAGVQAQIDVAKARIEAEVGKVVSAQQETLNPLYQDLLQQYTGLQGQGLAQAARVKGLDGAIQTQQKQLAALPQKQLGLAERLRTATQLAKTFELLNAKYHELKIQEAAVPASARVIDPARPGHSPIRPNRSLSLLLGVLTGVMLGVGLIFLLEQLDTTVKSPDDLERICDIPVLGVLPLLKDPSQQLVTAMDSRSSFAETFRMIRSSIQFASVGAPIHSLLVTSPGPGEGKSTTAANLAVVMAQKGLRVILIDCDLRRPSVHKVFKINNTVGLTTAIVGMAQPEEVLFRTSVENLCIVPAGPLPPNPAELLDSVRAREVFQRYREAADLIIFDTPPCTALTDAPSLASQADGVVLVIHASKTDRKAVQRAVHLLREAGARLYGGVLNKINLDREGYYYRSYYYYYYSEPENSEEENDRPRRNGLVARMLGSGNKRH